MRKKNLKPVITGSVLIIPAILLGAGLNASAKSTLPKIGTGSSGIKFNQMKLPRMTPSTGGLKTIANKVIKANPFKSPSSNINNGNKTRVTVDRCNSISPSNGSNKINSNKGSLQFNNDPDFNPNSTGPVYENVLTLNTSGNKGTQPTLSPKNRPLPPIPGSEGNSSGSLGKRPAYNPSKGKAPAPPSNVEPYRPGSTNGNKNKLSVKNNNNIFDDPIYEEIDIPNSGTNSKLHGTGNSINNNKLSSKNNKNNNPIYDEVPDEPIYESIGDPIYQNTGNFNDPIYDMPN